MEVSRFAENDNIVSDVVQSAATAASDAASVSLSAEQVRPSCHLAHFFHADVTTVSRFKTRVQLLRETCHHCTVRDARLVRHNSADCPGAKLCHFCASTLHFRTACLCPRSYQNKCYRCGFGLWHYIRVHNVEGGFGTATSHCANVQSICIRIWTMRLRNVCVLQVCEPS